MTALAPDELVRALRTHELGPLSQRLAALSSDLAALNQRLVELESAPPPPPVAPTVSRLVLGVWNGTAAHVPLPAIQGFSIDGQNFRQVEHSGSGLIFQDSEHIVSNAAGLLLAQVDLAANYEADPGPLALHLDLRPLGAIWAPVTPQGLGLFSGLLKGTLCGFVQPNAMVEPLLQPSSFVAPQASGTLLGRLAFTHLAWD